MERSVLARGCRMRDGRPILYRVPDFEPSTEPCAELPPARPCGMEPPAVPPPSGTPSPEVPPAGAVSAGGSSAGALSPGPSSAGRLSPGAQSPGAQSPGALSAEAPSGRMLSPGAQPPAPGTPSVRAGTRRSNSGRGAKPAPSESPGAVSAPPASTCAPAETPAGCRPRIDRKSLRANRSAPAGIRRAHRAGHTADARTEPSEARAFAGRAIRILLEVLDRRRPVAQLNTLCAPALVHTVGVLVAGDHAPSRTLGTAALTKFRLFPADGHAFELIAMYQRGPRRLALAGRVEHTATGWKLTALRLA